MSTKLYKIYSVGMGQRFQCAQREDGQWFIRGRSHLGRWARWEKCRGRPVGAWYNPNLAKEARLPAVGDTVHEYVGLTQDYVTFESEPTIVRR